MPQRVLIIQSAPASAQPLADFFARRGDSLWQTANPAEMLPLVGKHSPDLLLLDLHLPGEEWLTALREVRAKHPSTKIIITNKHPDFRRELLAKEQGIHVFLREPFEPAWIERALKRLTDQTATAPPPAPRDRQLPPVRTPVRVKITLPYALLALFFAAASAYLVSRYVLESIRDRFTSQLINAGQLSAEWMVSEEDRLLSTLRLIANVAGMAESLTAADATRLRDLALPIAVNNHIEAVEILSRAGTSVLSVHHQPESGVADYDLSQGSTEFAGWTFVSKVLAAQVDEQGDKYAGLASTSWGDMFYVAGPVFDGAGQLVGAVLVGRSLDSLVRAMRQDTVAHITVYDVNGRPYASTLDLGEERLTPELASSVLARQTDQSWMHDLTLAQVKYTEILGPWEARGGVDVGLLGVTLAQNFLARPTLLTNVQAFAVVFVAFIAVVLVGVVLANRITRPLLQMVNASAEVARGNFEIKVTPSGDDEVAVMGHAFNYMVSGLQEGAIYRDLLGRTVSPEVREELRESFASGHLRLEGQTAIATVLMSDIRGFTTLSEHAEPTTILAWLNEYFSELVPVITARGGVVDKFEGDAILAVFGVLPRPLPAEESAYQASRAAVEMLRVVRRLNARRQARGEPLFTTGIGVNTGPVTAGGLGTADRLNYTVIGDTVNTTQRLESFTREFGESGSIISQSTWDAMGERRSDFRLEPLGAHTFKGKSEPLAIHRLWPSRAGQDNGEVKSA